MKLQTALSFAAFGYVTNGCLLPEESDGKSISLRRRQGNNNYAPIGTGDRFEGGNKAPQGIGSNPQAFQDASQLSILGLSEIESALKGLQKAYPGKMTLTQADDKTVENRAIHYAVAGSQSPRVFLTSGVHPRERGGPDNIIYLISDLLWADKKNTGLRYGSKEYNVEQVRQALGAGIAIIPAVNPDGINHDQTTNSCWRKNRQPFGNQVGVDINRNFNVFWEYERIFSPSAGAGGRGVSMSKDPSKETYIGPRPYSEPETRSINNVFERVKSLSWYLDLHSVSGQVLYSWGDDYTQSNNPDMSFRNKEYDGKRGLKQDEYKEYMELEDFNAQKAVAERMASAMNGVANKNQYRADETMELYPALGSTDEAMAKYYNHTCGANRINALTFEFGEKKRYYGNCQLYFYPSREQYKDNIIHTNVGLMEFLLNAAGEQGKVKTWNQDCDASQQPTPTPSKPEQQGSNKLTPAQQKCVDQYLPPFKQCQDEACKARIRDEVKKCMKQPEQLVGSTQPVESKPPQTARECQESNLPKWQACGTDRACQDKVRQEILSCIERAKATEGKPSEPAQPAQPEESKPKTDQECQQKYLPKWRECNNDRACQSQVKKDYEACKEQVKSTQAKPVEPEEPQPKTDQECRDKYSPKWQQCRNDGTCQDQVRKDIQACLEQVKTAQAKPSTPAQPAQPEESKPKTDQECQQKYSPKWQECRNDRTCQDQVRKDFEDCKEQLKQPKTAQECNQKYYPNWQACGTGGTCQSQVRREILDCLDRVKAQAASN